MVSKSFHILNVEPLDYAAEARMLLEDLGTLIEKEMSRSELLEELYNYDVLIVRLAHQIDRKIIDAGRRLKAIVSATTGLDHIDVAYARTRKIAVLSLQGEVSFLRSVSATAEHTWALLLSLLRWIVPASSAVNHGEWNRDAFRGHELNGKRLGIVGLGRIGEKVARYAQVFGMEVAAYDPFTANRLDDVWCAPILTDLLERSDVLSLHVPLTNETRGMIGAVELALLPAGALLINTSRGQLIDEVALVQALDRGHLAGAALDVLADERHADRRLNSPLLAYASKHNNLLITPHIGGATYESMAKTEVFMARKLKEFLLSLDKESKEM
jgi:D-3-phosphoglycerate dehydrogenase